jgi:hypothetical protein
VQLKFAFFWNITTLADEAIMISRNVGHQPQWLNATPQKRTSNRVNSEQHYDVSRTYWLYYYYYVVASNVPGITLLLTNTKQHNHLYYISFKTAPCATIHFCQRLYRCWEQPWKSFCKSHFSSSVAFLMTSVASQKLVPSMLISVEKTGKNQPEPGQESMGNAPVCHILW